MAHHRVQQWSTFARLWWLYDCNNQCPIKSASRIATYLQGKHKPIYHPLSDLGDHVIVINTRYISAKQLFWNTWKYYEHNRYPNSPIESSMEEMHRADPTQVILQEVRRNIRGTLLRPNMLQRLHLFADAQVPQALLENVHDQIEQVQSVPKALNEYSRAEVDAYPKLFDFPPDFVLERSEREFITRGDSLTPNAAQSSPQSQSQPSHSATQAKPAPAGAKAAKK